MHFLTRVDLKAAIRYLRYNNGDRASRDTAGLLVWLISLPSVWRERALLGSAGDADLQAPPGLHIGAAITHDAEGNAVSTPFYW